MKGYYFLTNLETGKSIMYRTENACCKAANRLYSQGKGRKFEVTKLNEETMNFEQVMTISE